MGKIYYIVAKHNEPLYEKYIGEYFKQKNIDPIIVTDGMADSMCMKYNVGISLISKTIEDDDIICFVHEDIKILDEHFEEKVKLVFEQKPNIGILGIYGTKQFERGGGWWLCDRLRYAVGQIMQERPDMKEPFYMSNNPGFSDKLVSVDGCIFMLKGKIIKDGTDRLFDEERYDGYHFYDCDTCFNVVEQGYDVAVAFILVQHASEGPLSESWNVSKNKFIEKWEGRGLTFPATVEKLRNLPI